MKKAPKEKVTYYQSEIWISDKVRFCFWYPEDEYEPLQEEISKCIRRKDDFWFGDKEVKEVSLETWDGKFLFHFKEDEIEGLCIPWDKVIAWNLCSYELN